MEKNLTEFANKNGYRIWKGIKGNIYLKLNGNGRNGITILFIEASKIMTKINEYITKN
jgi:hypothetical protein